MKFYYKTCVNYTNKAFTQLTLHCGSFKQHLQNDLDKAVKWPEKWQMLLHFGKCKCLHTGHGNLDVNYTMEDTVLGTTVKEKDLGVTISTDMKVSEQCGVAASKGNKILGLIMRNITYEEKS